MRPTAGIDVHEYELDASLRGGVIAVGVPTIGMISIRWHLCMVGLQAPMNTPIWNCYVIGREVGDARNEIVQKALAFTHPKTGARCSHVFFVDDDCLVPMSALKRLHERRLPIAAGLYYGKAEPAEPLILTTKHGGTAEHWVRGTLIPCYAHGMGCTLIETEVFRRMYHAGHADLTDAVCQSCNGAGCAGCFETGKVIRWFYTVRGLVQHDELGPEVYSQTEDAYFCERAALAGYQPTVDTGVQVFHYDSGSGYAYPLPQWDEYRRTGDVTAWPREVPA